MKTYLVPQYSPEWWALRAGRPTASDFDKIFTGGGKDSDQRTAYLAELINGRLNPTGNAFSETGNRMGTPAMEAGRACEPQARAYYAFTRNVTVKEVGVVISECGRYGCSPDGLIGAKLLTRGREPNPTGGRDLQWVECTAEGGLELKCPQPATQAKYLKKPHELPTKYKPQVHGQIIVCGVPWWDFLSFVEEDTPVLVRVVPDDYTQALREALERFCQTYQEAWDDLLARQRGELAEAV